ncbi:protein of unknown function [Burkholderia multivorans]
MFGGCLIYAWFNWKIKLSGKLFTIRDMSANHRTIAAVPATETQFGPAATYRRRPARLARTCPGRLSAGHPARRLINHIGVRSGRLRAGHARRPADIGRIDTGGRRRTRASLSARPGRPVAA